MALERIYVCTSKNSKLYRVYLLQTGDTEKSGIYKHFEGDLIPKKSNEAEMDELSGTALIEDIPYYLELEKVNEDSYLFGFKEVIGELLNNQTQNVIQFSKFGKLAGEVKNFDEDEGIKFIIAQDESSLYFLAISNNSVIKNKPVLSISVTDNTTVVNVPKGIQLPPAVTARLDRSSKFLYVYDVNRFENMLTLNENRKAKSQAVITKFIQGDYTISTSNFKFVGLEQEAVKQKLFSSARAVRRLSKYTEPESSYSIVQIKQAVNRLDSELRVEFDEDNNTIKVTPETAKTFVGIINNIIVERLISGDVEIVI